MCGQAEAQALRLALDHGVQRHRGMGDGDQRLLHQVAQHATQVGLVSHYHDGRGDPS